MSNEWVMCPATQAAIDRIVHDQFRSREQMLETLRSEAWTTERFCCALLEGWKSRDLTLATGHSTDWWIMTMNRLSASEVG